MRQDYTAKVAREMGCLPPPRITRLDRWALRCPIWPIQRWALSRYASKSLAFIRALPRLEDPTSPEGT